MADLERNDLFSRFCGEPPASAAEIERVEREIGLKLPKDYAAFMQRFNGGEGFIGPNAYVILYSLDYIVKTNKEYEVQEYAPGYFIFGSDGGGEAFAFNTETSKMDVFSLPFIGMEPDAALLIASTFEGFLEELARS